MADYAHVPATHATIAPEAPRIGVMLSGVASLSLNTPRNMASVNANGSSEWYVYIVRCADGSLYTGIALDVAARVAAHNAGVGAKYTRQRRPVALVYSESAPARGAALRRESSIKRLDRVAKQALIASQSGGGHD